jgi:ribosome-associated protein
MATRKAKAPAKKKAGAGKGARGAKATRGGKPAAKDGAKKKGRFVTPRDGRMTEGRGRAPAKAKASQKKVAAGPQPAGGAAPAAAAPDLARPTALAIANAALDKKAEDVTVLDVRGLASYADYFVLMTADSDRQASAIADHVEATMKAKGHTKVGAEGYETGRWILVDYGDVLAHVMSRDTRQFYDLEGLWADAPRLQVEG